MRLKEEPFARPQIQGAIMLSRAALIRLAMTPVQLLSLDFERPGSSAPGMAWKAVSVAELEKLVGIDVFPALPAEVKEHTMMLPRPELHGHGARR
jgi:hypothetical protein